MLKICGLFLIQFLFVIGSSAQNSIEFFINPYTCTSCLLSANNFQNSTLNASKNFRFSDNFSVDEIEAFMQSRKLNLPYAFFNSDSLSSAGLDEYLDQGFLKVHTLFDSFVLVDQEVTNFFRYPQLYLPRFTSTQITQLENFQGPNYFNFDQYQKGIYLINRNIGIDSISHFINDTLTYRYGISSNFYRDMFKSIHKDTTNYYKWVHMKNLIQGASSASVSMVNIYQIFYVDSIRCFVFGTFFNHQNPKSDDIIIGPVYFSAELKEGQITNPTYIPSNGNIIEQILIDDEKQQIYKLGKHLEKDSIDLSKGIIGYKLLFKNKVRHKKIKASKFIRSSYNRNLIHYEYLDPVNKVIVLDSTLIDFYEKATTTVDSSAIYLGAKNITKRGSGYVVCTVSPQNEFEVKYMNLSSNQVTILFRENRNNINSNILYLSNGISYISKNKKLVFIEI